MEPSFPPFFHSSDLQYVMVRNVLYWVISPLLLQTCFHVLTVLVLTVKPLKCGSAASCFAEQKMLLWAWDAVSVSAGLTPRTAHPPVGSVCTGTDGLGSTAWTGKPRRDWGCLQGSPHCTWGSQASLQPCAPLMGKPARMVVWPCRSFKGASAGLCRSCPDSPGSTCGKAGDSAGCPLCWGSCAAGTVWGVGFLTATKSQLSQLLAGCYVLTLDRRWKEGQTALGTRKFTGSQDVAIFPNSWDFFLMVSSFILPKYRLNLMKDREFQPFWKWLLKIPFKQRNCLLLVWF